jgi:hypothetical protein
VCSPACVHVVDYAGACLLEVWYGGYGGRRTAVPVLASVAIVRSSYTAGTVRQLDVELQQ